MSSDLVQDQCSICLSNMSAGQGQAIYTTECSHSFHFNCFANSVHHGTRNCPVCGHIWNSVPFQSPGVVLNPSSLFNPINVQPPSPFLSPFQFGSNRDQHTSSYDEASIFTDDEPLPTTSPTPSSDPQSIAIKTYTEYSAIAAAESRPRFPVLVNIRAPRLSGQDRTPIDLVAVLDVSGSMYGLKLDLLKQAVKFVIENLGDSDRFSIVTFSDNAKRVLPLKRMSADGRECAVRAVESLWIDGCTNIVRGLEKGVKVLEDRRARNQVSSIILLSDGQDNHNRYSQIIEFVNLLPDAVRSGSIPVHTFGFGSDHDATVMNAISNSSGGTFSFIESFGMVQDAFAMCIGGLLSVVAQELQLTVRSASPGVQIVSIPSGRHECVISDECQQGVVEVGSMYAEEEKKFLVYLLVPAYSETGNGEGARKTQLLDVSCGYKDLASNKLNQVQGDRVEILRPEAWSSADESVCLEVDRERNRISAAEAIAEAQAMAERGNFQGAQASLAQGRQTIVESAAAQYGDGLSNWLDAELGETGARMSSSTSYAHTGRAYALAGLSAHTSQRATTRGDLTSRMFAAAGNVGFGSANLAAAPGASPSFGSGAFGASAFGGFAAARCASANSSFRGHPVPSGGFGSPFGASVSFAAAPGASDACLGGSVGSSASANRGFGYETAAMLSMVKRSSQQQNPEASDPKKI